MIFSIAQCDLIGFNRLGNNVYAYKRHRGTRRVPNYQVQVMQQIRGSIGNAKSIRRNRRLRNYTKNMKL